MKRAGWAVCAALVGMATLAGCLGSSNKGPEESAQGANGSTAGIASVSRATPYGTVVGLRDTASTTLQWLGVPFATPPVGAARWTPPQPPKAWAEPLKTQALGPFCSQLGSMFSPSAETGSFALSVRDGLGKPLGSEDCLSLNVFRPDSTADKLPVMVFIHGGSNVVGYSGDPIYQSAKLATVANAVVVTVNYRLGIFGWMDLQELKTGDAATDSGNFGILDQIQALKFIQQSISAFGGDPGNVTVMGESAGSVNAWALITSPLAKGLMHKVVSMSGGVQTKTPQEGRVYATRLLQGLVIADGKATDNATAAVYLATQTPAQIADYLRSKTNKQLLSTVAANALGAAPAVFNEGVVVPVNPHGELAAGNYNRVAMLAGNTLEEAKLFGSVVMAYKPTDRDRFTMMYNFDPNGPTVYTDADFINPQFLPVDMPGTGWNNVAYAMTTAVFSAATQESMNTLCANQSTQCWYYRFDWRQQPEPFNRVYGAVHALDLPFWFGNFGRNFFSWAFSEANRSGREQLSDAMMKTLATFAHTGQPRHEGLGATPWANWPSGLIFDATPKELVIGTIPLVTP